MRQEKNRSDTHISVLLHEVIEVLNPRPGEFFIDGTAGSGGHAVAIAERIAPDGKLLVIDWDAEAIQRSRENFQSIHVNSKFPISNIIFVQGNYADIPAILKKHNLPKADGLLLDLGFSSVQLAARGRGFSFMRDDPLRMTYDIRAKPVSAWIEEIKENVLADILRRYGGERYAGRIAKQIKKNLPIMSTGKLRDVVRAAVPRQYERGRIHPATRTFQALRIFANRELENLRVVLSELPEIMNAGGRVAIISFHSLEDKSVKEAFRRLVREGKAKLLVKKPIVPRRAEVLKNPRSRSAKLRAILMTY